MGWLQRRCPGSVCHRIWNKLGIVANGLAVDPRNTHGIFASLLGNMFFSKKEEGIQLIIAVREWLFAQTNMKVHSLSAWSGCLALAARVIPDSLHPSFETTHFVGAFANLVSSSERMGKVR